MVIVSSIALATMITNDLVMPMLWRGRWLKTTEGGDIGGLVLWLRRASILALALLAYAYHRNTVAPASLASIGLLAFAAVAQFAPPILAGLYWRRATRSAVFWGLATGFALWTFTLLLPNFNPGGSYGLRAAAALQALYGSIGIGRMSPVAGGALLALAGNVAGAGALSLLGAHLAAASAWRRRASCDRRCRRRRRRRSPARGSATCWRSPNASSAATRPTSALREHFLQTGRAAAATRRSGRPRPDAAHGARARGRDRRLLGPPDVHARPARPWPRRRGSRRAARRNLAGTALQPAAAAGHDGERVAGHLGGRRGGARSSPGTVATSRCSSTRPTWCGSGDRSPT